MNVSLFWSRDCFLCLFHLLLLSLCSPVLMATTSATTTTTTGAAGAGAATSGPKSTAALG